MVKVRASRRAGLKLYGFKKSRHHESDQSPADHFRLLKTCTQTSLPVIIQPMGAYFNGVNALMGVSLKISFIQAWLCGLQTGEVEPTFHLPTRTKSPRGSRAWLSDSRTVDKFYKWKRLSILNEVWCWSVSGGWIQPFSVKLECSQSVGDIGAGGKGPLISFTVIIRRHQNHIRSTSHGRS